MTRILSLSDLHCGNVSGLTPDRFNPDSEVGHKMHLYRAALYHWVTQEIDKLRPIDICVVNGDAIDGKGDKNGGLEQFTVDRTAQIEMAVEFCKWINAKEYHFTYGTAYHVGHEDDWENEVAIEFGTRPEPIIELNIHGLIMKWRHHSGGSAIFAARANALARQQLNDILWAVEGEERRADVLVYSHQHYFYVTMNRFGTTFVSPALQGFGGSQLGTRRMGGVTDYGFLHFDVNSKDDWSWKLHRLLQTKRVRSGELLVPSQAPAR